MNRKTSVNASIYFRTAWMLASLTALITFGCGSGEDLSANGGVGGTGVNVGEVSEFGSIFVNGVEMDTRQAQIFVEGELAGTGDNAARTHLRIGQRVVTHGSIADDRHGTALRVEAFDQVVGPLLASDTLDENTLELNIMGQTVIVDPQTALIGVTLETLTDGMLLKVSGLVDGNGAVHAGLMVMTSEQTAPDDIVSVKGTVQSLDAQQKVFGINALVVDYSQISTTVAFLAQDLSVAVQGTLSNGVLVAQSIKPFATENFESVDDFMVDGFITAPLSSGLWRMGRYRIRIDAATWFDGLDPDDLTAGLRIQARGRLRQRLLEVIQVKAAPRARMESNITTVDIAQRTLTLEGMTSIAIHVNRLTLISGNALSMAGIDPGDHVRILAVATGPESVAASIIFKAAGASADDRYLLQGPVTAISDQGFSILGVAIQTSADPAIAFQDADGQPLSAEEFLSALSPGAVARVSGQRSNGQILYQEMAIIK